MTLLFCDGFDTGDAANKWGGLQLGGTGTAPTYSTNTPFTAGKSAAFGVQGSGSTVFSRLNFTVNLGTLYVGFAFCLTIRAVAGDNALLRLFSDGGTKEHLRLMMGATGPMYWQRSPATTVATLALTPNLNQWYYLEAKLTLSDTVGEVTTRVDGNPDSSVTSIDTNNSATNLWFDTVSLGIQSTTSGASAAMLYDDFYLCDTAGTRNNTFLGPVRIQTLSPNGAGADTGLTPLSGSNYANAADQNAATYNYSAAVGARDTYALPDLATGTTSVLAVRNVLTGQNSDAGVGGFKPVVRSGGTIYYDPTVTVGASNKVYSQAVRETDPATSAAWTVPAVNALQVGAEVS